MNALVTVDFRGDTLFAVERDDGVFVAIKPICQRLGLAWNAQLERIKRDPVLLEGMRETRIPSPGGVQETVCLALRLINGWLFGISVNHVKPELREDVLAYQRECYETLADRFLGRRIGSADARPSAPTIEPGADPDYRLRLNTVTEARHCYGSARARLLYEKLGLPEVPELPPGYISEAAERAFAADAFAVALDAFARAHAPWTGTPRMLRAAMNAEAPASARKSRAWPGTDQALGNALKRLAPDLKARGILMERRHSGSRLITLALAES